MAEATFTIYTEPHVAHVGDVDYLFTPEIVTADVLDAYASMIKKRRDLAAGETPTGGDVVTEVEEQATHSRMVTDTLREFVARFMLEASQVEFASHVYMDTVLVGMQNFVLDTYGLRPTGPSSDSSQSSSTATSGDGSTEGSPSAA